MAHAHLRRCRQQNVPHTNRKYQQTPTAQNRCTDAEFWTQLSMLAAEATSPVVQIRRRSPQVQHAKPQDATNARTRRTTTESEASGTKGGTRTDRDTITHRQRQQHRNGKTGAKKKGRTHTPPATSNNREPNQAEAHTSQDRAAPRQAPRPGKQQTQTIKKKANREERNKQHAHTPPGKRTNKHKQTQTNANKHKQTTRDFSCVLS